MSRSSVKRNAARPRSAVQSDSADADDTGTSAGLPSEQIREMEAQYRSIFEAAGEAMVIANLDGVIVEANPAACQMYGYAHDELVGLPASMLVHPADLHLIAESPEAAQAGGSFLRQGVGLHKDGTLFHAEGRVTGFTFKGEPHVLMVVRDITERVQAEEQLKEREEQYRSVFEATTDGLVIHDSEGIIVEANPAFCQLHGYSRDEVIGRHATAFLHPDYHRVQAEGMQSIDAGKLVDSRTVNVRKDGTLVHVDGHGTPFVFKGNPNYLGIARDMTEQVEAEERLREREAQYRSIFESSLDAISIVDMEGKLAEVNPAFCQMVGYSHDELLGMPGSALVHPDHHHVNAEAMQTIREGGEVRTEMTLVRKDGSLVQVDGRATAFTYKGKPHILVLSRDISERVQAEEQLREKEEQYRAIFESTIDGLVILDLHGTIVEANAASCEMFGYARDELIGLNAVVLTPPEGLPELAEALQRAAEENHIPHSAAAKSIRKDGSLLDVESQGRPFIYKGRPHLLAVVRDITERVKAQEQLREKEAQYRSIFEATTDGLGVVDMEGYIVEVNPAYCQMYGYRRDEVIGLHALALMHSDYHHLLADGMRSIVMGNPVRVRSAGLRKDGTSFPVDGRGTTFLFNGKPHILGISRDITEQVQAEEELREREAEYGAVFDATTDGLVVNDLETGVIVEANPAFCRMHGYTHEEMVGMHPSQHIRPDCHHLFSEYVRTVSRGATFHTEAVDVRKDGTEFPVDVSGRAFTFRGKPSVLGIVRDVTERVQAEEQRREQEEQLREREQQYRSIFEATTDGLAIADMEGRVVEANPAYCQMYGYSYDEVIGLDAAATVHGDYHQQLAEAFQAIETGNRFQAHTVAVRKDGTLFHIDGHGTPFLFNGKPHVLGVSRDITEQVQAEEQLREKEEQYRSIFESSADGLGIYDQTGFLV